jgi:hypothetical protein
MRKCPRCYGTGYLLWDYDYYCWLCWGWGTVTVSDDLWYVTAGYLEDEYDYYAYTDWD